MSKGVSKFHHLMVDLEPTVAEKHPPLTRRMGGTAEGGRKRQRWRFGHQYELKVTVTLLYSGCDYRVQSRKLLGVVSYLGVLPPPQVCFRRDHEHTSEMAGQRVLK